MAKGSFGAAILEVCLMDVYVALTGLPACGKETFKDLLFLAATERGFQNHHISFTDVLRDECVRRGVECNRENYTNIANALRSEFGSDILAERIVEKVQGVQAQQQASRLFVLEAVRNPREADLFRSRLGNGFALVGITAPRELLIERIRTRKRLDEQPGVMDSRAAAEALLDREWGVNQPETGLRVGDCLAVSDFLIDNSGDLQSLEMQVRRLLARLRGEA